MSHPMSRKYLTLLLRGDALLREGVTTALHYLELVGDDDLNEQAVCGSVDDHADLGF